MHLIKVTQFILQMIFALFLPHEYGHVSHSYTAIECISWLSIHVHFILILKNRKSKICRGSESGGWGEILGNVYISWMCCGFVVNQTYGSAASVLNTQQRFVYMERCRGSMPVTAKCISMGWPLVYFVYVLFILHVSGRFQFTN